MSQNTNNPYRMGQSQGYYSQDKAANSKSGHSILGIISFVISILMGISTFVLFAIAGIIASGPGGMGEESPEAIAIGLGVFGILGVCLIGGILGLVGILMPGRSKLFGVLGLVFNIMVFLGLLSLILIGIAIG